MMLGPGSPPSRTPRNCDSKWHAKGTPCRCCDYGRGWFQERIKVQTVERLLSVKFKNLDTLQLSWTNATKEGRCQPTFRNQVAHYRAVQKGFTAIATGGLRSLYFLPVRLSVCTGPKSGPRMGSHVAHF